MAGQVISKKRVADHGEVFTAEREVDAMLNLVERQTERIDSRFLEPACGTGNFLVPILKRKLEVVKKKYSKSQLEFERYAVVAIGSIYGVDILEDNVKECQDRLFDVFDAVYTALYKKKCKDSCRETARFILGRNILWGDARSLKTAGKHPVPIIFSQWSPFNGSLIKRHDYSFAELIPSDAQDKSLFAELHISDLGTPAFLPNSVKEYPLRHFLELPHETEN